MSYLVVVATLVIGTVSAGGALQNYKRSEWVISGMLAFISVAELACLISALWR